MRVQILKDYVKQHFPATPLLDYALEVEKITTSKVKSTELLLSPLLLGELCLGSILGLNCRSRVVLGVALLWQT